MRISKSVLGLMITGAIGAAFTNAYGAFNVTRNGVTWAGTFEGDSYPDAASPVWAVSAAGSSSGSTNGNMWTQTTATNSYLYYEQTDPTWTSTGSQKTFEFMIQVVNQTASDRAFDVIASDASGYWDVQLSSTGVQIAGSIAIGSVIPVNNSTFHTYRLTIDETLSVDQAKLYLDNNPTPIQTSGANSPGGTGLGNGLYFGDLSSGGVGGTTAMHFTSWTSGVFPAGSFSTTNGAPATIAQGVGISWFASNAITYQVQSTTNLTTNTVWTNFGGLIVGDGATNTAFDAFNNVPKKFYRVLSLQ